MHISNPFCVYLVTYRGNKLPPFYIGSTSISNLERGYKGSVSSKQYKNIWKSEWKLNPHLFKITIISHHETRKLAAIKESNLQSILAVNKNPLYVNKAIYNGEHILYTPTPKRGSDHHNYGRKHSIETRLKMKGPKHSVEVRQRMSEQRRGSGHPRFGKPHTKEGIKNIRMSRSHRIWYIKHPDGHIESVPNLAIWCESQGFTKIKSACISLRQTGKYKQFTICQP